MTLRRYERIATLVLLNATNPNTTQAPSRAALIDISIGGAAFECSTEFFVGDSITLRVIRSGKNIYALNGVIKRIQNKVGIFLYGVEFKDMTSSDNKKLKKLISKIGKYNK